MENNSNISVNQDSGNNQVSVSGVSDTRLAIDVANNRSRYYAELAESYKNETKEYRDSTQTYIANNNNVIKTYVDNLETTLRNLISTKQAAGNYALSSEIPTVPTKLSSFTDDLGSSPTHTHSQYLTSHQDISGKENTSNKVTSISAQSTDTQYPSAKCVYDNVKNKLENTATGSNSLSILGDSTESNYANNIGKSTSVSAVASNVFGYGASATASYGTALGHNAKITATEAIQIGMGTNSTAQSLSIGFRGGGTNVNYQLLDGTTGKIPNARLDMDATVTSASTKPITSGAVYDAIQGSGNGTSRNIGEIVTSTIPLTDAGLHLLDGALISGSGSYADFVTYIASLYADSDYSAIFDTEASWQATVTSTGYCDKFVYTAASGNNSATVRLPKFGSELVTNETISATTPVKGNGMALGLTDGTTNYGLQGGNSNDFYELCLQTANYGANVGSNSLSTRQDIHYNAFGVSTDGSKSGIIADLSGINLNSANVYYYIVVATSTKTELEVDIDEIATDLNGKADVDLTNVSPSSAFATAMNSAGIRTVVYQTTSNGCDIRVWSDGLKEIFCKQITNASTGAVSISYPTNSTQYAFTAEPTLIVNQYQLASATTATTARGTGYARSATGFSVYFLAANASISYYACGY